MSKINSGIELEFLLMDRFKFRFIPHPMSGFNGNIFGKFDGNIINIMFWPHDSIILSGPVGSNIDELIPVLNEVMDNNGPICKYDLRDYKETEPRTSNVEWDIKNAHKRLKDLVNDRGFEDGGEVTTIEILNGKTVDDYKDTEEERRELLKNARIHGIDKSFITGDASKLTAPELFLLIKQYGLEISRANMINNSPMSHRHIDTTELEYAYDYLIYQTKKFGVLVSEPKYGRRILVESNSFDAWFEFYYNFFEGLTSEQVLEIRAARNRGEDMTKYMPEGDWRDYLKKEHEETPIQPQLKPKENEDENQE